MNSSNHTRPGRILLVDDDRTYREAIGMLLQDNGYHTRGVSNGEECLSFAALWKPDLILLDVSMPGKDGFETCIELKDDEELGAIPVLFMTSHDDPDSISCAFELGAQDYITKPPHKAVLLARVRAHLMRKRDHETLNGRLREQVAEIKRVCRQLGTQVDAVASGPPDDEVAPLLGRLRDDYGRMLARIDAIMPNESLSAGCGARSSTTQDLYAALGECVRHLAFSQKKAVSVTRLGEVPDATLDHPPDTLCPALMIELAPLFADRPADGRIEMRIVLEDDFVCRVELKWVSDDTLMADVREERSIAYPEGLTRTRFFHNDKLAKLFVQFPLKVPCQEKAAVLKESF